MRKQRIRILLLLLLAVTCWAAVKFVQFRDNRRVYLGGKIPSINPQKYFKEYGTLGFSNAHILKADGSGFTWGNLVVEDGQIIYISDSVMMKGVEYIDLNGSYIVPGFIDTHVHLSESKNDLYLYLANGVTGICEMFGNDEHLTWRHEIEEGAPGPRMYISTPKIGRIRGLKPLLSRFHKGQLNFSSKITTRIRLKSFSKRNFDAIKMGSFVDQKLYDYIQEVGQQLEMPIIGHLGQGIEFHHFLASSQIQLAHIDEILKHLEYEFGGLTTENRDEFVQYAKLATDTLIPQLKEHHKFVSSTLRFEENRLDQLFQPEELLQVIELSYVNPAILEGRNGALNWLDSNPIDDPELRSLKATRIELLQEFTQLLAKEDVLLTAGSDANMFGMVPGYSLHEELQSLVKAGFSTKQALKSVTQNAAAFMQNSSGRLEAGLPSDLVVLRNNPLESISNTRSIEMVIANTHQINHDDIRKLLDAIEELYDKHRSIELPEFNNSKDMEP